MTDKVYTSTRHVKGKKAKSGPTLWQIFFNDEDPSSPPQAVKLEDRARAGGSVTHAMNTRRNPFELDGASASSGDEEEAEVGGVTANGLIHTKVENETVIFEKKRTVNEGQPILNKGECIDQCVEKVLIGVASVLGKD